MISLSLGLPKLTARIDPPRGVNNTGVSAATPAIPYFFQIVTNLRFRPENFFRLPRNLLTILLRSQFPKKAKAKTTVIIPATVAMMVVNKFNPTVYPPKGPSINFSMLEKYTRTISSHILKWLLILTLTGYPFIHKVFLCVTFVASVSPDCPAGSGMVVFHKDPKCKAYLQKGCF